MNRLPGAATLSLLLCVFTLPASGEASVASASASGVITEAPAASTPAQGASASAAAASADGSAVAAVAPAASTPAVGAPVAPSAAASVAPLLNWKAGPRDIALLDQAIIKIPQGFAYLEQEDARQLLRKLGNPNVDNVNGAVTGPGGNWLIVVRFNKVGYIADEAPEWKPDELLDTLKRNVEKTNAIRKKNESGESEIVGWLEKPNYDAQKHRLIWAVSSRDKGAKESDFQSANFNVYSFGREGYVSLNLVTDLAQLEQNKKYASTLASAIAYNDGKKYRDFKKGSDKLSPFSMSALVTGNDASGAADKKDADSGPPESKLTKFIKIFGLILLGLLVIAGAAFGVYYFVRRRRAATAAAEVPAEAGAPEAPTGK